MWFWICQLFYKCITWPTKCSILLLYRRIFGDTPGIRAWGLNFNTTVRTVLALFVASFISSEIVTIFACTPVPRNWNKSIQGSCVQTIPWWYSYGSINIASDFIALLLPMPLIKRLAIPLRQKIVLFLIFGVSAFICFVTVYRMTTINATLHAKDDTYGGVTTLEWTVVETNVGIMCACLPLFRPIITWFFPRFARTVTGGRYPSHTGKSKESATGTRSSTHLEGGWKYWGREGHIIMSDVTAKPRGSSDSEMTITGTDHGGITKVTDFEMTTQPASPVERLSDEMTLNERNRSQGSDTLKVSRHSCMGRSNL